MNTFLTPIVFVSNKDYQMKNDFVLDSDVENIRNSFTYEQQKGHHKQKHS